MTMKIINLKDLDTGWAAKVPTADALPDRLQTAERQNETLRAQLDAMRGALRPFAMWADYLPSDGPDSRELAAHGSDLTYGDVRRAHAAMLVFRGDV